MELTNAGLPQTHHHHNPILSTLPTTILQPSILTTPLFNSDLQFPLLFFTVIYKLFIMPPKADWEKYKAPVDDEDSGPQKEIIPLSEGDIQVLKTYVSALPFFLKHKAN